ncbi:MAG TPA: flavodoxin family protein [Mycobacterium sp.]|nr:flavodoxin family protein [Mycobacterium sp.]
MKSLIVCVSISHGNTRRVADRIAEVLDADVAGPEMLHGYDLVGFGSGTYFGIVHPRLWMFVRRVPRVDGVRAFMLFTSGGPEVLLFGYGWPIRHRLASKGFRVLDSFSCRGFDTVGQFGLIGGLNKGRPNERDRDRAAAFAVRLRERLARSQTAS